VQITKKGEKVNMDIGNGIAAGSAIIGSVAVGFKIVDAVFGKQNGNGKGKWISVRFKNWSIIK
jgi:hypothetical protein